MRQLCIITSPPARSDCHRHFLPLLFALSPSFVLPRSLISYQHPHQSFFALHFYTNIVSLIQIYSFRRTTIDCIKTTHRLEPIRHFFSKVNFEVFMIFRLFPRQDPTFSVVFQPVSPRNLVQWLFPIYRKQFRLITRCGKYFSGNSWASSKRGDDWFVWFVDVPCSFARYVHLTAQLSPFIRSSPSHMSFSYPFLSLSSLLRNEMGCAIFSCSVKSKSIRRRFLASLRIP